MGRIYEHLAPGTVFMYVHIDIPPNIFIITTHTPDSKTSRYSSSYPHQHAPAPRQR